jgi:hypothetical protein
MGRRSLVSVAVLVVVACGHVAGAGADTVASVTRPTGVSSAAGYTAWSSYTAGVYRLVVEHAGVVRVPAVPSRPVPFDADVGTDARGRAVIAFSRCYLDGLYSYPDTSDVWDAKVCTLRQLDPRSGRERALRVPGAAGSSDTAPSIWRGRIAFARTIVGQTVISHVRLYDPRTGRVRRMAGGTSATGCDGCAPDAVHDTVVSMDLGPSALTFLWYRQGNPDDEGSWQVRVDSLSSAGAGTAATGIIIEACISDGIDYVRPSWPAVAGRAVYFSIYRSACGVPSALEARFDLVTRRLATRPMPGIVLDSSLGPDGGVAVIAPAEPTGNAPYCAPPDPCAIERVASAFGDARRGR